MGASLEGRAWPQGPPPREEGMEEEHTAPQRPPRAIKNTQGKEESKDGPWKPQGLWPRALAPGAWAGVGVVAASPGGSSPGWPPGDTCEGLRSRVLLAGTIAPGAGPVGRDVPLGCPRPSVRARAASANCTPRPWFCQLALKGSLPWPQRSPCPFSTAPSTVPGPWHRLSNYILPEALPDRSPHQ